MQSIFERKAKSLTSLFELAWKVVVVLLITATFPPNYLTRAQTKKVLRAEGLAAVGEYDVSDFTSDVRGSDLKILRDVFDKLFIQQTRLDAGLLFVEEIGGPNAFAIPETIGGKTDGSIVLGKKLMGALYIPLRGGVRSKEFYALFTVIAHELAHLQQFKEGVHLQGKAVELDADYRAGIIIEHFINPGEPGAAAAYKSGDEEWVKPGGDFVFSQGDYEFNDPQHHGSSVERLQAFLKGVLDSRRRRELPIDFSNNLIFLDCDGVNFPSTQDDAAESFDRSRVRHVCFAFFGFARPHLAPFQTSEELSVSYTYWDPFGKVVCEKSMKVQVVRGTRWAQINGSCGPLRSRFRSSFVPGKYAVVARVEGRPIANGEFTIR